MFFGWKLDCVIFVSDEVEMYKDMLRYDNHLFSANPTYECFNFSSKSAANSFSERKLLYVQVILGVSKLGRDTHTHTHMYTRLNLYMNT